MYAQTINPVVKDGDKQQLDYIKNRYDAFVVEKFRLLDEIDLLQDKHKPFAHLSITCQQITTELIRLDETRNGILNVKA